MRDILGRIASALERMSPAPADPVELDSDIVRRWDGAALHPVRAFVPLPLALVSGVDRQKAAVHENTRRHADGAAAHDVLLWGARGMGKSALVKSVVAALAGEGRSLLLVEATSDRVGTLPALLDQLSRSNRASIVFIDDVAFAEADPAARLLRSMLEGGAEARPANVRIYATSNRRNIVERWHSISTGEINSRDADDDSLALADRFGLKLGFQYPDQAEWLAMVRGYASHFGLPYDEGDALAFGHGRGQRSGRTAWHYAVELAGRNGRPLA